MLLTAIVGDHTWQTPAWPLLVTLGNAAASVVMAGLLAFLARRGGFGSSNLGIGALLLTPLFAGLACALPFALLPSALLTDSKLPLEVFAGPLFSELGGSAVALCALGFGLAGWLYAERKPGVPVPVIPLVLFPVFGAIGLAGPAHVLALDAQGTLPRLDIDLGPRVHVGVDLSVPVLLDDQASRGWFAPPVHVAPREPGTVAVTLRAERVGLVGTRVVTREAGEDSGSALLPLAEGNTWDLQETVARRAQYLWFVDGDHTQDGRRIQLRVTAGPPGPLRTWVVSRRDDDDPPTTTHVYNWNGAILDAATDVPFLDTTAAPGQRLQPCRLAALSEWTCVCGTPPPPPAGLAAGWKDPWAFPGPASCEWQETPGAVRTGLGALVAMLTVGLVIDMGDARHTAVLARSGVTTPAAGADTK